MLTKNLGNRGSRATSGASPDDILPAFGRRSDIAASDHRVFEVLSIDDW